MRCSLSGHYHGRGKAINVFINKGVNVNVICRYGNAPLQFAYSNCASGNQAFPLAARSASQPANKSFLRNWTAKRVILAVSSAADAGTDLLLQWEADETARDKNGHTLTKLLNQNCNQRRCSEDEVEHVRILLA